MIPSKSLVYDFDLIFDRFKGEFKRNLRLEDKMRLLNRAQEFYFEKIAGYAETNDRVRNILRNLEEKEIEIKPSMKRDKYTVFKHPKDMYKMLSKRVLVSKEGCPPKEVPLIVFQTDDLNMGRTNFYWQSSYEWEHVLCDEGSKGLYVYHDDPELKVHKIIIDYIRKPQELHAPSMTTKKEYTDWNGVVRKHDADCELETNYSSTKIVDIAVLMGRAVQGDLQDFRTLLESTVQIDNISY